MSLRFPYAPPDLPARPQLRLISNSMNSLFTNFSDHGRDISGNSAPCGLSWNLLNSRNVERADHDSEQWVIADGGQFQVVIVSVDRNH
jgi:hypothetical protein